MRGFSSRILLGFFCVVPGLLAEETPGRAAVDGLVERYRKIEEGRAEDDSWPSISGERPFAKSLSAYLALSREVDALDEQKLDDGAWIDREILEGVLRYRAREYEVRMGDPSYPLLPAKPTLEILRGGSDQDTIDLYARLSRLPRILAEASWRTLPADRRAVEKALERIDRLSKLLAEHGPGAEGRLALFGSVPARARAGATLALEIYRRELASRELPRALPSGKGVGRLGFENRLANYHRIETPLDEIVELARLVLDQTDLAMQELAPTIEPGRTWQEITESMKSDGPPEGELVDFCSQTLESAIDFLRAKGFLPLPDYATNCGVRGEATRHNYPYAYYHPPEGEDLRGNFVVTTVGDWMTDLERSQKTRDSNRHWMTVVTVHEGLPGHHLQFAIAARNRTPMRSMYYTPFFSEGWALYVEDLMWRHGFYADPKVRLAQLRMRLWRAARVLCDVGIHTRTMTPDEAIRLLVERCLLEPESARKEVARYLESPTQPMSYLVGSCAIERMREAYRERHGDRPDWELEFHERLLSFGSVPLSLIEDVLLDRRAG